MKVYEDMTQENENLRYQVQELSRLVVSLQLTKQDLEAEVKSAQGRATDWQEQADYWEVMYMTEQGNRKIAEKVARKYKTAYDRLVDEMLK